MTGYGQTGPRRTWAGYHPTAAAGAGLTRLCAYRDSQPIGFTKLYLDYMPGYVGAKGRIKALLRRERTGRDDWGDHIDVSRLETVMTLVGPEAIVRQVNGLLLTPEGGSVRIETAASVGCSAPFAVGLFGT